VRTLKRFYTAVVIAAVVFVVVVALAVVSDVVGKKR